MRLIDPEVRECKALVIDGNSTSRSALMNMLRDIGVGHISQTSRVTDAKQELEITTFDIVLCDYHFDKSPMSGQELLDDLRQSQLLPYSTVFVMVTGERSYLKVVEAAESALDSYLLKPHNAAALEERVLLARRRKRVLGYIFEAIRQGDFEGAAKMCLSRFSQREEFWLYAGHVGAELLMRLKDHTSAKAVYTAAYQSEGLQWARLGMARAEFESGQAPKAIHILEGLIEAFPEYADAYDVMSQVQLEQGDLAAALETSRDSVRVTPQSITRLQKQGMLAFLLGENKEATQTLDRTVRIGLKSKLFDFQTLVVMALLYFDEGNLVDLKRTLTHLEIASERRPGNAHLRRMAHVAGALNRLSTGSLTGCLSLARKIGADIAHMDFDYEAASNLLALLARLRKANVAVPEADTWVNDLSRRFCVSKASCEMLCIAAGNDPIYSALIHEGHHSISNMAEEAMAHSVSGEPSVAVEALLLRGAETCNAKLIELAGAVLSRHSAQIGVFDALNKKVNDLKIRYCAKGAQVRLGQNPLRAAGGLNLRT